MSGFATNEEAHAFDWAREKISESWSPPIPYEQAQIMWDAARAHFTTSCDIAQGGDDKPVVGDATISATDLGLRERALGFAIGYDAKPNEVVDRAKAFLSFLTGGAA